MTKKADARKALDSAELRSVAADTACDRFSGDGWTATSVYVPNEMKLTIYVNGRELVTISCTPIKLPYLVFGFLYSEGIISGAADVTTIRLCEDESLADVRLADSDYEPPTQRTITSGCGGGATFESRARKIESDLTATPTQILSLMKRLRKRMVLYRISGGVHTSALADTEKLIVVAEDIGRHNTLDKIQGECLLREIPTRDRLLLSTGRVSSEMLLKAARMEVPIVVSRHSLTESAVSLARDLGITLVGYARGGRLSAYSHSERLGCPGS